MERELELETMKRGLSEFKKAMLEGHANERIYDALIDGVVEPLLVKKTMPIEIVFGDVYIKLPADDLEAAETATKLLDIYKTNLVAPKGKHGT